MTTKPAPEHPTEKFIIRGIHLDLTPSLRQAALDKAARLLRHDDHIIRVRIDLEMDQTRSTNDQFIAKGRIEIRGPDLIASTHSDDAYKSLDQLVDLLDELLRRRNQKRVNTRNDERRQAPEMLHGEK